jgi:glycosyltransferase involved in cell wall biosynthesis
MKGVSVVICCYNSSSRLPETLKYLAGQKVPANIAWEVIIVNNASKDDTAEVARAEWDKYGLSKAGLCVVDELTAGLSHARDTGIKAARYEYVIFCDDDNWLEPNYITTSFNVLDGDLNIGAVGGQSEACTNGVFPSWFEEYKEAYVVGKQGVTTGDISTRGYLWGAGIALRKSVFIKAFSKIPSLLTDRKGETLTSGGDSEICRRLLLMNYKLYYSEDLKFTHFIPQGRLTTTYRDNLISSFYACNQVLNKYSELIHIKKNSSLNKAKFLLASGVRLSLGALTLVRNFDVEREKRVIFFITNLNLKVDTHAKLIKQLLN